MDLAPTAGIDRITLREAATRARDTFKQKFEADCAKERACYAEAKQGFLWRKRKPTPAEVDVWFSSSLYDDGFSNGIYLRSAINLGCAQRLLALADTPSITDIRLPENDLRFLAPFLNEKTEH